MGASDPQLISVYRTAVAVFQNSQKNCSPTQASAAIFLGSCAIFLGSHGTHSWSPSRERKLIITTRFEERRTISLPGSSSMRLCRFFGIKENPSFEQRGGGGKGGGGRGFISEPSDPNESKNTKPPHYHHYCQIAGNQLADTGQTDIREKPSRQGRSEPCRVESFK